MTSRSKRAVIISRIMRGLGLIILVSCHFEERSPGEGLVIGHFIISHMYRITGAAARAPTTIKSAHPNSFSSHF